MLQDRAIDREHDDQGRRHIDRDAEDAFQRNEQVTDQARDVEAAMRPWRRQIRPEIGVEQEQHGDDRHDRAGGAARRFQYQQHEYAAEDDIPAFRHGGAVGEIVAAPQRVDDDADAGQRRNDIKPLNAIAETAGERKQRETQHQHEGDVNVAQLLRRHDVVGGKEMEQRHQDGDAHHRGAGPTGEAVTGALFLLDVFFGLAQALSGNRGIGFQINVARHFPPKAPAPKADETLFAGRLLSGSGPAVEPSGGHFRARFYHLCRSCSARRPGQAPAA